MSFGSVAQEFVEALARAPIFKLKGLAMAGESASIGERFETEEKPLSVSLDAILRFPKPVLESARSLLGLDHDSLIMVLQALVSTNEANLKPVQCRPTSWNQFFGEFSASIPGFPLSYDAFLKKNERDNRIRLEMDRSFVRLIILLHNAFAHRIEDLRDAILDIVGHEEGAVKKCYDFYCAGALAEGEIAARFDKAIGWNVQMSGTIITAMMIHMAFHQEFADGFDLFHIRDLYDAATCGLFATSMFLGFLAAPSGCLSIGNLSMPYLRKLRELFVFLKTQEEEGSWFYPGVSKMFAGIHSLLIYHPQHFLYPVDVDLETTESKFVKKLFKESPLLENTTIRDAKSIRFVGMAYGKAWNSIALAKDDSQPEKEAEPDSSVQTVDELESTDIDEDPKTEEVLDPEEIVSVVDEDKETAVVVEDEETQEVDESAVVVVDEEEDPSPPPCSFGRKRKTESALGPANRVQVQGGGKKQKRRR